MPSRRVQAGISFTLFVVVALLVAVAAFVAMKIFERSQSPGDRSVAAQQRFQRIQDALVAYVAQSQSLPCPADPSLDTGDAVPATAAATCTFAATGTVPWKTIGIGRDEAFDSWSNKISYRVFSGPTGLTQANGASMVNCDFSNGVTTPNASSLAPGGLCGLAHDHIYSDFLTGKGLRVNDFGTNRTDIAYVLVSHGPTGLGAYTSSGTRKPVPTSANELANINTSTAAGLFVAQAPSAQGTDPNAATHFDDVLGFQSIAEFIRKANLAERDWPENFVIGYTMDSATVSAGVGQTVNSPGSVGDDRIDFARARVTGSDSGGNQDIAFNTAGGAPGIGIAGNGSSLMTSLFGERLRIDFAQRGYKLGVALSDLGTYDLLGTTYTERVQFRFSGGTSTVTVIKSGCKADGGVASFSIDPGTDFDRVDILPLGATPSSFLATTSTALADFKLCDASANGCFSNLATVANSCP